MSEARVRVRSPLASFVPLSSPLCPPDSGGGALSRSSHFWRAARSFDRPCAVAATRDGKTIYVADYGNSRVRVVYEVVRTMDLVRVGLTRDGLTCNL